jgi:DNA-binding Lrp family transcriptional regulator
MNSKEAMKKACAERGIKEIAECLKLSPTAIYNQINDPDKNDILSKFVDFVNACGNDVAVRWVCEELNGIFVKNPDVVVTGHDSMKPPYVPDALREFSEVIREISKAMEDERITKEEAAGIRREWDELKAVLERFVLACEFGYMDGKDEES